MRPLSILLIAFALALHVPVSALAQEGILVLDTSVTTDFPFSVTFHLEAQSTSAIDRAEVRFQVQRRACAQTESSGFPELEPGTHIATEWEWDLRTGGSLPPGSVVRYRWLVRDVTGQQVETPEATHQVMDNRFRWDTLEGDMLTLYWHQGDLEFARALMESARQALDRLEAFSGVRPVTPVKLFIYGSSQELQEALVFPQEWTGGVSFNGFNTVAIGINTDSLAWGQRAIAHELTHVVTDQVTFNCLGDTPTWLSEGLATYNEHASTEPQSSYANALENGISNSKLLSVRSLSGGFPTATDEATLAYGQSYSLVQYLRETYGAEMLGDLLEAFQAGSTTDAALQSVYGFDQQGLDSEWREYVGAAPGVEGPDRRTPTPLVPTIPTFEPFTLATPAPDPEVTPTPQGSYGGGCNAGLPVVRDPSSKTGKQPFLPLSLVPLAGVLLGIRTRHR